MSLTQLAAQGLVASFNISTVIIKKKVKVFLYTDFNFYIFFLNIETNNALTEVTVYANANTTLFTKSS